MGLCRFGIVQAPFSASHESEELRHLVSDACMDASKHGVYLEFDSS